ncbi:MAG: acetyl-CoA carboxylase, carboxyltransferase subunit beta [Bacillota bacterium]|nr:acetyl-CoA carboxylase, carboxyltransferase subunit beta [Bacillota bacterium]
MSLFNRKKVLDSVRSLRKTSQENEELFLKCKQCDNPITVSELDRNLKVCQHCLSYFEMSGAERFRYLLDEGYKILSLGTKSQDPIVFPEYKAKLSQIEKEKGLKEALTVAVGSIRQQPICVAVLEPSFLMGSMGTFMGEELTRTFEYAMKKNLPMLVISASGGARMQEGIFSLMQMAKTAAVVRKFAEKKLLYISLLTNPTMGGVSASFASLGDIILAEPRALIGFAGPRVIEQTMKQKLPEGFQRAEKLVDCGFVDAVVERRHQREYIARILKLHG